MVRRPGCAGRARCMSTGWRRRRSRRCLQRTRPCKWRSPSPSRSTASQGPHNTLSCCNLGPTWNNSVPGLERGRPMSRNSNAPRRHVTGRGPGCNRAGTRPKRCPFCSTAFQVWSNTVSGHNSPHNQSTSRHPSPRGAFLRSSSPSSCPFPAGARKGPCHRLSRRATACKRPAARAGRLPRSPLPLRAADRPRRPSAKQLRHR
mmetsp:Transcript_25460/g.64102  ORF Transcript_25460/g.64102 Transcript_25460/m.64102 type:complete len:203 (-) Transcript_25460:204-812(-)